MLWEPGGWARVGFLGGTFGFLEEVPGQLGQPAGVEHGRNRSSAKGLTGSISLNAQKCSEVVTISALDLRYGGWVSGIFPKKVTTWLRPKG